MNIMHLSLIFIVRHSKKEIKYLFSHAQDAKMMKTDIFDLVKACKIFSCLPDKVIHDLINHLQTLEIPRGKILFRQGEYPDGLFILVSGKMVVLVKDVENEEKLVTDVHAGETLGEVGVISHEPRTATAKALEDSVLVKLSGLEFRDICLAYPDVLQHTMELLSQRSKNLTKLFSSKQLDKKHVVFSIANKEVAFNQFLEKIRAHINKLSNVIIIRDDDEEFNKKYSTLASIKKHITELSKRYTQIFYFLDLQDSLLAEAAMDMVDMLYIVAHGEAKIYLNQNTLKRIHARELIYKAKPALIVLHEKINIAPQQTSAWLKLAKFGLQHHVRIQEEKDWGRIIRFICGQAVGLVLGGGGVRGWAHVGALKALIEAGVPIDVIGGTSGGSIVAGYYALHETYEDCHQQLRKLSKIAGESIFLKNLTWPAVSWFSSKSYTSQLKKMFGKAHIENLWLPLFCVTCNLAKNNQAIQRDGLLWKKIRASTAVPGVYPPLVIKGQMHLDGGIVNNLPVDMMRQLSPNIGTIIAVELIHNVKDEKKYKFPPVLPFWSTLFTKLGLIHKNYRFPGFVDTFLRSLLVGSAVKQTENAKTADVLISPDLSSFGLLSVTLQQEKELIEMGYQATIKALKQWHRGQDTKRRPKNAGRQSQETTVTEE